MAERIVFAAYGVTAELTVRAPDLVERARAILPPGWRPGDPDAVQARFELCGDWTVTVDGTAVGEPARAPGGAIGKLDSTIRGRLALLATDFVFVHAGAVAVDGAAIVMPGHSFAGKTSLVEALVAAGATYLSDEFAVLDEAGYVHPYAKPLSIRRDGRWMQDDVDVAELGGAAADRALPVGVIAVTRYEADRRWEPARRTAAEGAMAMLQHTLAARARPAQALSVLQRTADRALVLEGPRGEAEAAAEALIEALGNYGPRP